MVDVFRWSLLHLEAGYEKEMETFFEANPGFKSHLVSSHKIWISGLSGGLQQDILFAETEKVLFETGSFANMGIIHPTRTSKTEGSGIFQPSLVDL